MVEGYVTHFRFRVTCTLLLSSRRRRQLFITYRKMAQTSSKDKKMEQPKKQNRISTAATNYLIAYNLIQFVGWTAINILAILHFMEKGTFIGVWDKVGIWLKIFQTASLLEVLHAVVRIVSSNPMMALFQIYSRLFVIWGIVDQVQSSQESIGVPLVLFTWTVTEMIRYSYYFFNLLSFVPQFLTWCRYTFFIVLYPCGVTGELLCIFAALPTVKRTSLWTLDLPNKLNFSFNYYYYIILMILGYFPIFPQLYLYMFKQRGKILGPKKTD